MRTRVLLAIGIAIVAAVFLAQVISAKNRRLVAKESLALSDMKHLRIALQLYRNHNGGYPTETEGIAAMVHRPNSAVEGHWRQLMQKEPQDPWQKPYVYRFVGEAKPDQFELRSLGPDSVESTDDIVLP